MDWLGDGRTWFWSFVIILGGVVAALLVHAVFYSIATRVAQRTRSKLDDSLWLHSRRPMRSLAALIAATLVMPLTLFPPWFRGRVEHGLLVGDIALVAWLLVAVSRVAEDYAASRPGLSSSDDLAARRVQTQILVLRRIVAVIIVTLAVAFMLMTFPRVRRYGETLFASAGVAGVILGLASRTTFTNWLAGVQIALTQPIRIGDVVVVEGEWGTIEEIGTTYVVVRVWDQRRLVLPLTYFIEKPFQNWTRQTSHIMGTAFFYVDYSVPVEAVRSELHRVLQSTPLWDQQVWALQVTNTNDKTIELRALMSSLDSSRNFDLRCLVRERLVAFLQNNYPASLPQTRGQLLMRGLKDEGEKAA